MFELKPEHTFRMLRLVYLQILVLFAEIIFLVLVPHILIDIVDLEKLALLLLLDLIECALVRLPHFPVFADLVKDLNCFREVDLAELEQDDELTDCAGHYVELPDELLPLGDELLLGFANDADLEVSLREAEIVQVVDEFQLLPLIDCFQGVVKVYEVV